MDGQLIVLADMEGASGIFRANREACRHGSSLWASYGRDCITSDVLAVCEAAIAFGIDDILLYDVKTDTLAYQGETVRFFLDILASNGETLDGGQFSGSIRSHSSEEGTVDMYAARNEMGELTGVARYSQEEFDARTYGWSTQGGEASEYTVNVSGK